MVTLSIVSFNTKDLLRECLRSVSTASQSVKMQVIVVDNASSDGSADMVSAEFPQVTLIRNSRNRFYGPAHNQSLRLATEKYVGLLNADTVLFEDTLPKLVDFMNAHPEAGASTCRYIRPDGRELLAEAHNHWRFHSLAYIVLARNSTGSRIYDKFRRDRDSTQSGEHPVETDVVSDTFLFTRREAMLRIGGYDERFRLYATEDDLCARLKRAGYKVFYFPGTAIVHALSASVRRTSPYQIRWIFAQDSMRYFLKYGSPVTRIMAVPALICAYIVDAAVIAKRKGKWR